MPSKAYTAQVQLFYNEWEHYQFSPLYNDRCSVSVQCKLNNTVVTIWWVANIKYTSTGSLKLFVGHRYSMLSQWLFWQLGTFNIYKKDNNMFHLQYTVFVLIQNDWYSIYHLILSARKEMSSSMTKPTKWHMRLAKTQISLGIRPSPIRVLAVRMKKAWVLSYPLSTQRRLWSDWADAQVDLSLCWVHSHFVGFVMRQIKCQCVGLAKCTSMQKRLALIL